MATKAAAAVEKPVTGFTFEDAEPPASKGGPGRKTSPEMLAFIAQLAELPMSDREDKATGWKQVNAPDVSAFVTALRSAGVKLGVSFMIRHDTKITDDDTLNPGIVKFKKVAIRPRGPRKAK